MASNPFDPTLGGIFGLGSLPVERPSSPFSNSGSPAPTTNPMARTLADLLSKPALPVSPYPYSGAAAELFGPKPALPVSPYPYTAAIEALFSPAPPLPALSGSAVADLFPPPSSRPFGLAGLVAPPAPPPKPVAPTVKRRAFFSFHFDDSMRVNVVRNAWKITHPDSATMRSFQDSSLWEAKKITNDNAIKALIRGGVSSTSAVCVLVGSETWWRRWVRYEIARAIVDGRGLLAVHLNSIRHHRTLTPHTRGSNPLDFMAIGKPPSDPWKPVRYFLYEKNAVPDGLGGYRWEWQRYSDYTDAVTLPGWVIDPAAGFVTPLSENADEYDYMASEGHRNLGSWLDRAAKRAGR